MKLSIERFFVMLATAATTASASLRTERSLAYGYNNGYGNNNAQQQGGYNNNAQQGGYNNAEAQAGYANAYNNNQAQQWNENYQYAQNQRYNERWEEYGGLDLSKYSIKYTGCSMVEEYNFEYDGQEDSPAVINQRYATFRMCKNSCSNDMNSGCSSDYIDTVVRMDDYLDMVDRDENQYSEYLECQAVDMDYYEGRYGENYNNNGEQVQFYIGPKCDGQYDSSGQTISLGIYTDEECTVYPERDLSVVDVLGYNPAPSGMQAFPDFCVRCTYSEDGNNYWYNNAYGNGYGYQNADEVEISESCETLYELSSQCNRNNEDWNYNIDMKKSKTSSSSLSAMWDQIWTKSKKLYDDVVSGDDDSMMKAYGGRNNNYRNYGNQQNGQQNYQQNYNQNNMYNGQYGMQSMEYWENYQLLVKKVYSDAVGCAFIDNLDHIVPGGEGAWEKFSSQVIHLTGTESLVNRTPMSPGHVTGLFITALAVVIMLFWTCNLRGRVQALTKPWTPGPRKGRFVARNKKQPQGRRPLVADEKGEADTVASSVGGDDWESPSVSVGNRPPLTRHDISPDAASKALMQPRGAPKPILTPLRSKPTPEAEPVSLEPAFASGFAAGFALANEQEKAQSMAAGSPLSVPTDANAGYTLPADGSVEETPSIQTIPRSPRSPRTFSPTSQSSGGEDPVEKMRSALKS